MKNSFLFIFLVLNISCSNYNTKWEEIKGIGINEMESLGGAIYFQDSLNGIIGGYKLVENKNSKNFENIDFIPVLYITKNGGKKWESVYIENIKGGVDNLKLENDTILCQIGDALVKSTDEGLTWMIIEKSTFKEINTTYFKDYNQYNISNYNFKFENKNYRVKESYKYKNVEIIVCYGEKSMTDYFFITKDNGKKWEFLQDEFGSNKRKFILKDEFLFAFDIPNRLQRIKLK